MNRGSLMVQEHPILLTTGQAAKLCAVTPDTVLKWIHKGRLKAERTAGGHFRIQRRELELSISSQGMEEPTERRPPQGQMPSVRCWEYMSDQGVVRAECRQCSVYRLGAPCCFLMAEQELDMGHARRLRGTSCQECAYYRRVKGLATKVLVITSDPGVMDHPAGEENESIAIRFVANAYEASAIMHSFPPAFAVIDEQFLTRERGLLASLSSDPRVPGLRIILLVAQSKKGSKEDGVKNSLIHSVIEKPITLRQVADVVDGLPVACLAPE